MLGTRRCHGVAIDLFQGDLTTFACDGMVNAANERLAGGAGVDGAIHRAGGPAILAECKAIGGCPTGEAVATGAGNLPARYVLHAVGPVWHGGASGEAEVLASAHRACLGLADRLGLRHIAFPAISTGAYAYPVEAAAAVALSAVKDYAEGARSGRALGRVSFVLFSAEHYRIFQTTLFKLIPEVDESCQS